MESVKRQVGKAAYDLKNLLIPVLGRSELLLLRLDADDPLRRHVEEIKASVEEAALLLQELQAFSQE